MSELVVSHQAIDRRCYNGCPSSDLSKELSSKKKAKEQIMGLGGSITYFPAGGFFVGFDRNNTHKIITKDCYSFWECYQLCYNYFEGKG